MPDRPFARLSIGDSGCGVCRAILAPQRAYPPIAWRFCEITGY